MSSWAVKREMTAHAATIQRRRFLAGSGVALGTIALAQLASANEPTDQRRTVMHHAPQAKRVIYLFMHGGPSQIDLFDYKPRLKDWHGEEIPASVRGEQRLTGMTSNQKE